MTAEDPKRNSAPDYARLRQEAPKAVFSVTAEDPKRNQPQNAPEGASMKVGSFSFLCLYHPPPPQAAEEWDGSPDYGWFSKQEADKHCQGGESATSEGSASSPDTDSDGTVDTEPKDTGTGAPAKKKLKRATKSQQQAIMLQSSQAAEVDVMPLDDFLTHSSKMDCGALRLLSSHLYPGRNNYSAGHLGKLQALRQPQKRRYIYHCRSPLAICLYLYKHIAIFIL